MSKFGSPKRGAVLLSAASFLVAMFAAFPSHAVTLRQVTAAPSVNAASGNPTGNYLFTWYDIGIGEGPGASGPDQFGAGDNIIRLIDPNGCGNGGVSNGACGSETDLCAMFYVFDDDQEMGECCGGRITPNQLDTFSVAAQLTTNWALPSSDNASGVIAVVGSGINDAGPDGSCAHPNFTCNAGCNPTLAPVTTGPTNLDGAILHNQTIGGTSGRTQIPLFDNGAGDSTNNAYLVAQCAALVANSSGAGACSFAPPAFVYVNNNGDPGQVSAFRVNNDGSLTPVPGGPFVTGGFGGACVDIDSTGGVVVMHQTLYATDFGTGDTSAQRINFNGSLSSLATSPYADSSGVSPVGLAASADGQYLFVGDGFDFGPGTGIDSFAIAGDGSLTLNPSSPFAVGQQAGFDVDFDPTRGHVISNDNDNHLSAFNVGAGGSLTPLGTSPYTSATTDNSKMALRTQGDCLFVAGGFGNQADVFQVDGAGNLTQAPSAPVTLAGATLVPGVTTVPSGQFVYFASDAGIFGFSVGAGCALKSVPGSPLVAGTQPAGLVTDNTGTLLFDVDAADLVVRSFQIASNGSLTPISQQPLQGRASDPFPAFCPSGISYVQF